MDSSPEPPRYWLLSKSNFWIGIIKPLFFILFASQHFVPQEQTCNCDANGSKKKCHPKCQNFLPWSLKMPWNALFRNAHIKIFPTLRMKVVQPLSHTYPYTHLCCMTDMLLDVISCRLHNIFFLFLPIFWRTLSRVYNMSASPCVQWFSCALVYCLCPSILKENEWLFLSYVYLRPSSNVELLCAESNA